MKAKDVKRDLLDQLDRCGVAGEHFTDLINDYMSLWEIKNRLIADIKKRGVSVKWQNSEHSYGYKRNESISELLKTSGQMLRILKQLGVEPGRDFTDDDLEM